VILAIVAATLLLQSATPATPAAVDAAPADHFTKAITLVGPVDRVPFLRCEGSIETERGTSALEVLWSARAPRRLIVRERLPDGSIAESGCDGTRGWMRVPGRAAPLEVEPAAVLAGNAGIVPPLMLLALADRFPQRKPGTDETIGGVACRRLEMEDRDGVPGVAWFDAATGRLRAFRVQARRSQPATITTITAWTTVGPLLVPSGFESIRDGATTRVRFTRFDAEPLDPAAFAPPTAGGK
jgi:hypothetical protein